MGSELRPVRGTHDILPEEHRVYDRILSSVRDIFGRYGFEPFSTPVIEYTEVFKRTLGDASDIVAKEMYTFDDRGGDSVTLRPEFTAGIARAFITNGLAQKIPLKLWSSGPLFRYERPQKGRYRQFHQINAEWLGAADPSADVETIVLAADILKSLGLEAKTRLEINSLADGESRLKFREALTSYLSGVKDKLSADSRVRLEKNPLRILDSKDPGDRELLQNAPTLAEHSTPAAADFFKKVQEGLSASGVSFTINPMIVRGLDYYGHTTFEFTTELLGAQNAVLGGGRYDGLIEQMGGPKTPAVGFAAGLERLALLIDSPLPPHRPIALIPIGRTAENRAYALARSWRAEGLRVELFAGAGPGKGLQKASRKNAAAAVIFGDDELSASVFKLKTMDSGEERGVPENELLSALLQGYGDRS